MTLLKYNLMIFKYLKPLNYWQKYVQHLEHVANQETLEAPCNFIMKLEIIYAVNMRT